MKNNSFNHRSIKIMPLLYKSFQPILSQNSMKYTYIKAQFRTRYIFVCQISAAHVVIVLNTLLQKCVDNEHYLWISSQVQVVPLLNKASKVLTKQKRPKRLLGLSENTCLLLQQASHSNLINTGNFWSSQKRLVFLILSRLSNY